MDSNNPTASKLIGYAAIAYAEANNLKLNKFPEPNQPDDAQENLSVTDAKHIASTRDAGLIWIGVNTVISES